MMESLVKIPAKKLPKERALPQIAFCEFCVIFESCFFTEHLQEYPSICNIMEL